MVDARKVRGPKASISLVKISVWRLKEEWEILGTKKMELNENKY